jgi:hypothetical protein
MPTEPIEGEKDDDKPPFRESAEVLIAMWRANEYKDAKDAVQDCKALLYAVPPEHAGYRPRLEGILEEALMRLVEQEKARAAAADVEEANARRNAAPSPAKQAKPAKKVAAAVPAKAAKKKPPAKKAAKKKAPAKKAAKKKAPAKRAPAKKAAKKKAPAKKAK